MRHVLFSVLVCPAAAAPAVAQDEPGSKDHPLIARLPGYYIGAYKDADFDAHEFIAGADGERQRVEGRFCRSRTT